MLLPDVDEWKRLEEALRASEARRAETERELQLTIDTIQAFAWSARSDGSVEFFNQRYRDYTGRSLAELQGWGWTAAVHADDLCSLENAWAAMRACERAGETEFRLRRFDGEYRWLLFRASPLRDGQGNVVKWHGINVDIEDRKRAEEKQRQNSEDALARVRSELARVTHTMSLGVLTASIAHEVNQPLSGILTNASACLRMLAADPPNISGAVRTARLMLRDGNRAADVIARLRALFGKNEIVTEAIDINEATREVIALCQQGMQQSGISLEAVLDRHLPRVMGDRIQLQQVMLNLLKNACDALTGVEDRPKQIAVRATRDEDGGVRFTVRDSGVGIAPERIEELFDAFHTTKADGMGIGLSVSQSIIKSHRGRLWCELNDGPGATFAFSIPVSEKEEPSA